MRQARSGLRSPITRLNRDTVVSGEESWKLEAAEVFIITNCVLGAKWSVRRSGYRFFSC